uniref:Uncharacterized protein n=1 Tax=Solanum tuberosum TaxID=4113 RepID=M1DQC4_SOLTU
MAETNQEVEKDFMLAALMTQMDELAKNLVKIEIQCKRKDKYIPPHERRSLKDNEVKHLEGMLSIILHKVTEQYREMKEMKEDVEGMKGMSCPTAREPHGLCVTRSPPATKQGIAY